MFKFDTEERYDETGKSNIHSISAKITLMAVFIVVVSLVGSVINASSKSRKVVENVNSNYILQLLDIEHETIVGLIR